MTPGPIGGSAQTQGAVLHMKKRTYKIIAFSTLPLTFIGASFVGAPIAEWLAGFSADMAGLLSLLGYVVGLLVCALVWGAFMMPLRAQTDMKPLSMGLDEIASAGGWGAAVRQEQAKQQPQRRSANPKERATYHRAMAIGGAVTALVAIPINIALWSDDRIMWLFVVAAPVGVILGLYHLAMWLHCRRSKEPS